MVTEMADRTKLGFWHANRNGNGAAAIFGFSPENQSIFLEVLPQNKDENGPKYNANDKIIMKLEMTDIGQILAVLNGIVDGMGRYNDGKWSGIYHQSNNGQTSTTLSLLPREEPGYSMSISQKKGGDPVRLGMYLSIGEAEELKLFLQNPHHPMFERDNPQQN